MVPSNSPGKADGTFQRHTPHTRAPALQLASRGCVCSAKVSVSQRRTFPSAETIVPAECRAEAPGLSRSRGGGCSDGAGGSRQRSPPPAQGRGGTDTLGLRSRAPGPRHRDPTPTQGPLTAVQPPPQPANAPRRRRVPRGRPVRPRGGTSGFPSGPRCRDDAPLPALGGWEQTPPGRGWVVVLLALYPRAATESPSHPPVGPRRAPRPCSLPSRRRGAPRSPLM